MVQWISLIKSTKAKYKDGSNWIMEDEKFEVRYMTPDFNGKNWINREKEFYFKDEAVYFSEKMLEKTGKKVAVYKKVTSYERIK